jgi:hypothetical protein
MTLKDYYKSLGRQTPPKTALIQDIAKLCKVTETTVRNWIIRDMKPINPEHIKIISKKTGIKESDLWKNKKQIKK